MGTVSILDITINYKFINHHLLNKETPLIIFLHEGLGSIEQWKDFPQIICDQTKLPALIYDRYGYGKSSKLKESRTIKYLATEGEDYLPELLEKLEITNKLILIGHSDGGSISLVYAGLYPERVLGVFAEASHVFVEEISRKGIELALDAYENGDLKEKLEKYHGENTESMFYGWANTWYSKKSFDWDLYKYLKNITSPIVAIQGENDEYGSIAQTEKIAELSQGEVHSYIISDCEHIPHFQKQEEVIDIIINHLSKLIS